MQRKKEEISQGVLAAEQEIVKLRSNNVSVKVCYRQTNIEEQIEPKSLHQCFPPPCFCPLPKMWKAQKKDAVLFSPLKFGKKNKYMKTGIFFGNVGGLKTISLILTIQVCSHIHTKGN